MLEPGLVWFLKTTEKVASPSSKKPSGTRQAPPKEKKLPLRGGLNLAVSAVLKFPDLAKSFVEWVEGFASVDE